MNDLTTEVRAALEATLEVAQIQFREASARRSKYAELHDEAARDENAASQTVTALKAALSEPEAPQGQYKTFGEE